MRIGLIGGGGFIGSYLMRTLQSRAIGEVRLFWRNPNVEPSSPVETIQGDLASYPDCQRFARGLDAIYYLAHHNTPVNSDLDQPSDAVLNMVPLLTLLKAIENLNSCPRIVYFSSGGALYGPSAGRVPFHEDMPCSPMCSYGVQKLAAEHYLRIAARNGHLTAVALRVGNAFGTLLPPHRMQGLIGVALNHALHRRPVRIFGNLENVRDYIHLSDICELAIRVLHDPEPFTILNAGRGEGHSVREVLGIVEACSGMPLDLLVDPGRGNNLCEWAVLDSGKARRRFDWEPKVTLEAGIADMVERWKNPGRNPASMTAGVRT